VIKDLLDHLRVFDMGDDLDGTAAFAAYLNLDIEYAFQPLRPIHGGTPLGGRLRFIGCPDLVALASLCQRHKHPVLAFWGDAPWKRVRLTPGLGTRAANLSMKSSGLKIDVSGAVPVRRLQLVTDVAWVNFGCN